MRRLALFTAMFATALSTLLVATPTGAMTASRVAGLHAGKKAPRVAAGTSDFNGDAFPDVAIGVPHDALEGASDAGAVNVMYGASVGIQVDNPADQRWSQNSLDVKGTAAPADLFGAALASGDFNGDGFADLAVGAPGDSVNTFAAAGVVNVLYGSATGLEAETPIDDQLWTQDSVNVLDQAEAGDAFGSSLTSGDFNGDGFADLAIGAPGEAIGTTKKAGAVSVLYGSAAGLQADAPDDQFLNQDSADVKGKVETSDQFAYALAAGDFNTDGFADLAVGVYGQDVSTLDQAGSVAILYGSAAGVQAVLPDDQVWTRDTTNVQDVADAFDHIGNALTVADFNGDGFVDLAAGVYGDDVGSPEIMDAGSVQVFYGSSGGIQAVSPDDQVWNQNTASVDGKSEKSDLLGTSVGAGDFNGDGFADLAIGTPTEDLDPNVDGGTVNVLYGTAGGLQAITPVDQQWTQDTVGVIGASEPGDRFGAGVTGADFNQDGFDDLVTGIPGEPSGGFDNAGGISGLYGTAGGLQADSPDDVRKTQGSVGVEGDPGAGDSFGAAVLSS